MDTVSIECRDLILPLKVQQKNKQTQLIKQNQNKQNQKNSHHSHKINEDLKTHTKSERK